MVVHAWIVYIVDVLSHEAEAEGFVFRLCDGSNSSEAKPKAKEL